MKDFSDFTDVDLNSELASDVPDNEVKFLYGLSFDDYKSWRVIGPPGTGKTTYLIGLVAEAIKNGLTDSDIAYIAFTNVAADEARNKVKKLDQIKGLTLKNFSTIHSLATKIGGDKGLGLVDKDLLRKFDASIQVSEEWLKPGDAASVVYRPKHPVLDAYSLQVNTKGKAMSFADWEKDKKSYFLESFFGERVSAERFDEMAQIYLDKYLSFKKGEAVVDFNDVLLNVTAEDFPQEKIPCFRLLIVDEAQDLTPLQWDFVERLSANSEVTVIAGDPDQAIMEGFGASPNRFLSFKTTEKDVYLEKSHRIPPKFKEWLDKRFSKILSGRLEEKTLPWSSNNLEKDFGVVGVFQRGFVDEGGQKKPITVEVDLNKLLRIVENSKDEEWLIMAPTKSSCDNISRGLVALNVPHFLHRKDVMGGSKIYVQTIHTSKGMDVDNAALVMDSYADNNMIIRDVKLRYVALTRAKKVLFPRVFGEVKLVGAVTALGG